MEALLVTQVLGSKETVDSQVCVDKSKTWMLLKGSGDDPRLVWIAATPPLTKTILSENIVVLTWQPGKGISGSRLQ